MDGVKARFVQSRSKLWFSSFIVQYLSFNSRLFEEFFINRRNNQDERLLPAGFQFQNELLVLPAPVLKDFPPSVWGADTQRRFKQNDVSVSSLRPTRTSDMLLLFTNDSTLLLRSSFSPSMLTALRLCRSSCQTTGRPYSSRSTTPPDPHFPPIVDWLPLKTGRSCIRRGGHFSAVQFTQLPDNLLLFLV